MLKFIHYVVLLVCAGISSVHGGPLWESTHLLITTEAGQREIVGTLKFQNVGDDPVKIFDTRSDCSCTVAGIEQKICAPGESGQLQVTFKPGDKEGHHLQRITVLTDVPDQATTGLVLETIIPVVAEIQPRMLLWRVGSASMSKDISIKTNPDNKIDLMKEVRGFRYKLTPVEGSLGEYRLHQSGSAQNESTHLHYGAAECRHS